ncbi:MAG: isoprenylcysteine carboxylmethyltransferase family protein [Acidiferrobacterales bacterium]|nr:isoprenylcysteine carboxylmethyltransferase family protein [Acidiferrobacterales bacterium]
MKVLLPPFLFMIFIIAIGLACWGLGSPHKLVYPYNLIGTPFIGIGLLLAAAGKNLFKKLGTNIMTFDEPTILVTQGVYKYSRNPMYLGFIIAVLGFSIVMGASISSFSLTVLFFVITDRWYISFEERVMHSKFGKDYEDYCRKVRRWI